MLGRGEKLMSDLLIMLGVVVAWFVISRFVLPRAGIST